MNVLDLFSGIGGFSLGLQQAGMETIAFCEIEDYARKVLKKHWPDIVIYNDVTQLDGRLYKGKVDIVCGGFPCQDISIAGKGAGIKKGTRSGLWTQFKRIIKESEPQYAIIENVSALLGRGLNIILKDLAEIGYDATWTTFDTQYFGLPQRRRRVYILAVRDGIPINADIFDFRGRIDQQHRTKVEVVKKSRIWNFTQGKGVGKTLAYFTRQRSDEYSCTGLSGTLAKRDYKAKTDLVLQDNIVRRVTPTERLRLQGFPHDWFDVEGMTDMEKFKSNGMSVNVVQHIGECINDFQLSRYR